MERKNDPLFQVKSWSDLTKEEKQIIRDSWDHTLPPEEFSYFMEKLEYSDSDTVLNFTGNLYIGGYLSCHDCAIKGDLVVCGNINSYNINVEGNFIVGEDICTGDDDIKVTGNFTVNGNLNGCGDINVDGSFIVHGNVDCYDINVCNEVTIDGNVKCAEFNACENATIGGNVDCTWDVFTGTNLAVKGNIECDDIDVFGNFEINGDLNCKDVMIQGNFAHGGKVKCDSLEVHCNIPEENN